MIGRYEFLAGVEIAKLHGRNQNQTRSVVKATIGHSGIKNI
jgi:hypothetical protein